MKVNEHNEQFELDNDLKQLDELLSQAMQVDPPAELSHRVYENTAELLPGQPLHRELAEAMAAAAPTDLAERVYQNTVGSLPANAFESELADALAANTPADLAERVYTATVGQLTGSQATEEAEKPAVVGRIGFGQRPAVRWAAAAMILLCTGTAIWMVRNLDVNPQQITIVKNALPTDTELQELQLALAGPDTAMNEQVQTLSQEVDDIALALEDSSEKDSLGEMLDDTDQALFEIMIEEL